LNDLKTGKGLSRRWRELKKEKKGYGIAKAEDKSKSAMYITNPIVYFRSEKELQTA